MGFGTWEQITDAYLACRGASHVGASGGAWEYTLTSANIPLHSHDMQHYHNTDITHKHEVTMYRSYPNLGAYGYGASSGTSIICLFDYGDERFININDGGGTKSSGNALVIGVGTTKTNTGDYGTANPTAISLMPTYVGVYTWYRSA